MWRRAAERLIHCCVIHPCRDAKITDHDKRDLGSTPANRQPYSKANLLSSTHGRGSLDEVLCTVLTLLCLYLVHVWKRTWSPNGIDLMGSLETTTNSPSRYPSPTLSQYRPLAFVSAYSLAQELSRAVQARTIPPDIQARTDCTLVFPRRCFAEARA